MISKLGYAAVVLMTIAFGCSSNNGKQAQSLLPPAGGKYGEVILIMDSAKWDGALGKEIRNVYQAPYPGLPTIEPSLSINRISPKTFNSVLKTARTLIFVATLDGKSYEDKLMRGYFSKGSLASIRKDTSKFFFSNNDVYATGQKVIYLINKSEENLINKLSKHKGKLRDFILSAEKKSMKLDMRRNINEELTNSLAEEHPYKIEVPQGYDIAKNLKNFTWLRQLDGINETSLFIYYEPYKDQTVFDDILDLRERITSTFIRDSEKPDIYLTYQQADGVPYAEREVNFRGNYAKKVSSLWKFSDISAGGPFISYTLVDESRKWLFYIEGYHYKPSGKKRNTMWELENILTSFTTKQKT